MQHKDFIEIHDYSADEVRQIFELARDIKKNPQQYRDALAGQTLAMIFEKSSTRTRVSFEVGMYQLGGHALFLSARDIQLGRGEPIYDTAKVLSRYVDGIMARTFAHKTVTDLAEYATVLSIVQSYFAEKSHSARKKYFRTNAERVYGVRA